MAPVVPPSLCATQVLLPHSSILPLRNKCVAPLHQTQVAVIHHPAQEEVLLRHTEASPRLPMAVALVQA